MVGVVTCLGCGGVVCQVCEDKSNAFTEQYKYWPLEVSVSRAALEEVQTAVDLYINEIELSGYFGERPQLHDELTNLVNVIRAHLQHPSTPTNSPGEDSSWLG